MSESTSPSSACVAGADHIRGLAGQHNCRVTHICDVNTAVTGGAATLVERGQMGVTPTVVQDLRRIMDNREIHAVTIATPNHWHSLAAIWAMQAGKHVYVEKPVSHNIWEGRRMVEAAGIQQDLPGGHANPQPARHPRSDSVHPRRAILAAHRRPRPLLQTPRHHRPHRRRSASPPPWIITSGAAPPPTAPLATALRHRPLRLALDLGLRQRRSRQSGHPSNGRRPLGPGQIELPRTCISVGGRFGYVDDGETPNTQIAVIDYGNAELIFEVRGLPTHNYRGASVGNVFHCTDGYVVFTSYTDAVAFNNDNREIRRFSGSGDHSATSSAPSAPADAQTSRGKSRRASLSALRHLANISYRLGRNVAFDRRDGVLGTGRDAGETLTRMVDHLRGDQDRARSDDADRRPAPHR